jgi:mitochondrial fission protein ELM1
MESGLKRVWVIDEGSPGHLAQSKALAIALQEAVSQIDVIELGACRRFSGLQRNLIRRLMGPAGRSAPAFIEKLILSEFELPVDGDSLPDIIISSGGKSAFVACVLSKRYRAPNIFVGERKPYPSEWFDTVLTPSPLETGVNDIAIDLIPTPVTPEKVKQAAAALDLGGGRLWAMVIGGSSRSHPFARKDWEALASGMNALAQRNGIRWLLTTSRRTGSVAESILKTQINPAALARSVWWSEKPEKLMLPILGHSECIFVTQDSVTMVSESIASGQPTFALAPEKVKFPASSFMPAYYQRLESSGLMQRVPLAKLSDFNGGRIKPPGSIHRQKKLSDLAHFLVERYARSD